MAAAPPLREAVKKVDRAVARLEELQCTIRRRNSDPQRHHSRQERQTLRHKVDVHVEEQPRSRRRCPPAASADPAGGKEWRHWSTPAGLVDGTVAEIVQALGGVGETGKENAGVKKKRRKKTPPADIPPALGRSQRRALESRPVNVVTEQASSPSVSGSDIKNVGLSSGEISRPKPAESGSSGRPPWRGFATITNNRPAATIAERVRPISAVSGGRSAAKTFDSPEVPTPAKARRRTSLPASGRASKAGVAEAGGGTPARPASAHENVEFCKTFCVDVRPNPNRPWRLAPKSNPSQPMVTFPNSAFRSAERGGKEVARTSGQQGSPKLTPFKSFQLRPLKLANLQQQRQTPPATIRPYLSPSKTSPRQHHQQHEQEDPLAFLFTNRLGNNKAPPSSANDSKSKKAKKDSSWLSKRLSLPCSPSSTALIRRFSLLHNNKEEGSPARPLPSLITRLPTRRKPTSIDSLLQATTTPPPRFTKTLSSTTATTPLVPPLPLPPALRVAGSKPHPKTHQFSSLNPSHRRSSSCQLRPLDANSPLHEDMEHTILPRKQKENLVQRSLSRSLSSRGVRDTLDPTRKKQSPAGLHCGAFPGCGSSVWPSMKRSWSSCQHHTSDCTSNCTGAGPCLLKHVKGWMHNNKHKSPKQV